MKILYILNDTKLAGSLISIFNLLSHVREHGVEPIIIIPDDTARQKEFDDIIKDYHYYSLPIVNSTIRKFPWGHFRLSYKWLKKRITIEKRKKDSYNAICSIIKQETPDLIHTNSGVIQEGYFAAKQYGIPHVWHLREYQDKDFNLSFYPNKDKVVSYFKDSYTITITKDIQSYFGLCSGKATTIYNGILDKSLIITSAKKENYFLCASQLVKAKCIDDVIEAFSLFWESHKDYSLYIAGSGSLMNVLQKLSKEKGEVSAHIKFLGFRKDVPELMSRAKALIVASKNEGFGRMTAEATFCNCLVIGRNTGGTKEILDYTGGVQYDGSVSDLKTKMDYVVNLSKDEYKENIKTAHEKAIEAYTIESNVNKTITFYKQILEHNA